MEITLSPAETRRLKDEGGAEEQEEVARAHHHPSLPAPLDERREEELTVELKPLVIPNLSILERLSDPDNEGSVRERNPLELGRDLWERREGRGRKALEMVDVAREGSEDGGGEEVGADGHIELR